LILLAACGETTKPPVREKVNESGVMQAPVETDDGLSDKERKLQNRERLVVPLEER
jgi:hypothetical protein